MIFLKKRKRNEKELEKIGNGEAESLLIKKENKKFWYTLGIALITLLIILVVSCVINIFKSAYRVNNIFGYVVLGLLVLIILIFMIIPILRIINAPSFTLDVTKANKTISNKNYRTLKSVSKNLLKGNNSIPFEEKQKIKSLLNNRYLLNKELNFVYDKYIRKDINKIIWSSSSKVACATGLSKNNTFDALTTIISNIRMIMQIVVKCGYRPSYTKLSKLIFKVFRNALIAYGIQSLNIGEMVVNCCEKFFKGLPAIGKPIASILEGAANGFFTARVGAITRKYLYQEFKLNSKFLSIEEVEENIAKEATIEAKDIIDNGGITSSVA